MRLLSATNNNSEIKISQVFTEEECKTLFKNQREEEGIVCKRCEGLNHRFMPNRWQWSCKNCGFRTTLKSGTPMENSKLSFKVWYAAVTIFANEDYGISAKELQRKLGLKRYQPAWSLLHKVRRVLAPLTWDESLKEKEKMLVSNIDVKEPVFRDGNIAGMNISSTLFLININLIPNDFAKYTFSKTIIPRPFLGARSGFIKFKNSRSILIQTFWEKIKQVHSNVKVQYLQNYLDSYLFQVKIMDECEELRRKRVIRRMAMP